MKAVKLAFVLACAGVCAQAHAQVLVAPAPPPIPADDLRNYCLYAGLIYSVGAQICVTRGAPPLYCDQPAGEPRGRAGWTTNRPAAIINCGSETGIGIAPPVTVVPRQP